MPYLSCHTNKFLKLHDLMQLLKSLISLKISNYLNSQIQKMRPNPMKKALLLVNLGFSSSFSCVPATEHSHTHYFKLENSTLLHSEGHFAIHKHSRRFAVSIIVAL